MPEASLPPPPPVFSPWERFLFFCIFLFFYSVYGWQRYTIYLAKYKTQNYWHKVIDKVVYASSIKEKVRAGSYY